ncbi:MAG: sugar ABC transporter permease [Clostridiaceae bacterium]|nr:sugar ABC transporter permease [Eubacteriales bacterium]NLV48468.1 sugar ABC transporter permease [Clostridiaceae bacterium]
MNKSQMAATLPTPAKKVSSMRSAKKMENVWGYVFILPNLIGFSVFTLFGIVFSLVMSFTDWNLLKGFDDLTFVGLNNFKAMIGDIYLKASLRNNLILLLVVPISLVLASVLASVLNRSIFGKAGARALYFLPYVTNMVAIATVWQALYHATKGPINAFLISLGVPSDSVPKWLNSSDWVLIGIMIILVWQNLGYYMLMYSAALQSIPESYYEAADIDGAGPVTKYFKITLPLLSPTTFLLTILGFIGSLQMWSFVQIITNGGPGTASYTLGLYIYRSAFETYRASYACALSWLLCFIVFIFTLIRWRTQGKWSAD